MSGASGAGEAMGAVLVVAAAHGVCLWAVGVDQQGEEGGATPLGAGVRDVVAVCPSLPRERAPVGPAGGL